jgi:thiamine-phosphate pyrophosphorylase
MSMLSNPTPAAARALEAAQAWAWRRGAPDLRPEHLLCGLLDEAEGRAAALLTLAGLDPSAIRGAFAEDLDRDLPPSPQALPCSPALSSVLDQACDLAREASAERAVSTEQLLLAVLSIDEALRRRLEAQGLAFARLEAEVLADQVPRLRLDEPLHLGESVEEMDTARILDANANRAREALRVIEDYCRFVLDDAFLTAECKRLRHGLREALATLPAGTLVEARDTLHDVGTGLATTAEWKRESVLAVVRANCKRLQEAMRSLEEFGKVHESRLGQALEQLRYRGYTLERAILVGAAARARLEEARLYVLLSGAGCTAALDWTIQEAAAGGAQIFQLREKQLSDRQLLERARQMRRWTRAVGALFIMNDRPDIARLAEADGVHVGQEELAVHEARRILGPDALVGVSTHNIDQVRQAVLDGASYIGVGPTFPSGTKDFAEFPGLDLVRRAAAETSLPTFVIGGVTLANIDQVVAAGGRRVAVSQAVCRADEPRQAALVLRQALDEN